MKVLLAMLQAMLMLFMSLLTQQNEGGGDGNDSNDGDDDEAGDDDDSDDNDDDDDDGASADDIKDPKAKITALEDQLKRRVRKDKRKDKTIANLQKQIDDLKAASQSDEDKKKSEESQREKEAEAIRAENERLKRERLILDHDDVAKLPKRRRKLVMKMVLDDLEIDDDGDDNLDELIEDAKRDDPELFGVKADTDKDDDKDDDASDKKQRTSASGKTIGSKKKTDKNGYDEAKLKQKFPALRGRTGVRV